MNKVLLSILFLLMVSGCSSTPQNVERPVLPRTNLINEYKIGVGDQLRINVWKNEEISTIAAVRPDGKISLPLVGDINAQGSSAADLSKDITKRLETFLRSPQVTVIVESAVSVDFLLRVRVTGAVSSPTTVAFKEGMTVMDLVLAAGGPTEFASQNKAKLYRKVGDEIKVYPIRLKDILHKGKLQTNYQLAPSDIITVPERLF